jgi:hypothetical protein
MSVHARRACRQGPKQRNQAGKPIGGSKIVLNVLVCVYAREWFGYIGLDCLQ